MSDLQARLLSYVTKTDSCWLWSGFKSPDGYGQIQIGQHPHISRGRRGTHRVMWVLTHGPVPKGLEVCHRCDVRACVNPEHLFLATHAENMRDMSRKNRSSDVAGEKNPTARLTETQVREIRAQPASIRTCDIAREYGLTHQAIQAVRRRRTWRHL